MTTYYNRFNEREAWDKIFFIPERELQVTELNELQSMFESKLKRLSDVFLSDGLAVSSATIIPPTTFPGIVRISQGYIYVGGQIIYTEEQDVQGEFIGEDTEWVYLTVEQQTLTEIVDTSLLDEAFGQVNFHLAGAHREILEIKFTNEVNKTDKSIQFAALYNGKSLFEEPLLASDKTLNALAERTYLESGSYLVEGGNLTLRDNLYDTTKYDIIISPYTSYLRGKRFVSKFSQTGIIDKPIETRNVQDIIAVKRAVGSSDGLTNNVFNIYNDFVKKVNVCTYPVRQTLSVLHGLSDGVDDLNLGGSVIEVISVGVGTYVVNDDYTVTQSGINWSPLGNEPQSGTYYNVDLVYYRTITIGLIDPYDLTKFTVEYPGEGNGNWREAQLIIKDPQYSDYVDVAIINPEYSIYKKRSDVIVLNELTGLLEIIKGEYADNSPPYPKIDEFDFPLFKLNPYTGHYYDAKTYKTEDLRIFRLTQKQLNILEQKVIGLKERLTDVQVETGSFAIPIKGLINDVYFNKLETSDKAYKSYNGENPLLPNPYNADFDNRSLTLPLVLNSNTSPVVEESNNLTTNQVYTLPYEDELYEEQSLASKTLNIQSHTNGSARINTTPGMEFIPDSRVVISKSTTDKGSSRISRELDTLRAGNIVNTIDEEEVIAIGCSIDQTRGIAVGETPFIPDSIEVSCYPSSHIINRFLKRRTITVKGRGWNVPNISSYTLRCVVGDVEIAGFSTTTSIQEDYTFEGVITLPENLPLGQAKIRVWTDPEYLSAVTSFTCTGELIVNKTLENIPGTLKPIEFLDSEINTLPPIVQTISVSEDMFLSSIGVFFKTKSVDFDVECLICPIIEDQPTNEYIGATHLDPNNIVMSNDVTAETIFKFKFPVFLKAGRYGIIIRSNSIDYTIWVASRTQTDVITNNTILTQPHPQPFFVSSNGASWTVIPEDSLKFKLYKAKFTSTTQELLLEQQTIDDSWLLLLTQYFEYGNSKCTIYYNIDDGEGWQLYNLGEKKKLHSNLRVTKCQLKFVLSTENEYVTPVLYNEIQTLYWKYNGYGWFYSNIINFNDVNKFGRVKIDLSGISKNLKFQLYLIASTDGVTWYNYNSINFPSKSYVLNPELDLFSYVYTFDMTTDFTDPNLAKYLMIGIELGEETYNGNDTPRLMDLKVQVFNDVLLVKNFFMQELMELESTDIGIKKDTTLKESINSEEVIGVLNKTTVIDDVTIIITEEFDVRHLFSFTTVYDGGIGVEFLDISP